MILIVNTLGIFVTFFLLLQHRLSWLRDSHGIGLDAGITESVDILSSDAETVTFARYHEIGLNCWYRLTQRMTRLGDYHPRAFTVAFRLYGISDDRATSVVRWRLPDDRGLAGAQVHSSPIRGWLWRTWVKMKILPCSSTKFARVSPSSLFLRTKSSNSRRRYLASLSRMGLISIIQ